jgi:hypothetical protein
MPVTIITPVALVLTKQDLATVFGEASIVRAIGGSMSSASQNESDRGESDPLASENSKRDANFPTSEPRPNSPVSQRPTVPEIRPLEAQLKPLEAPLIPLINYKSFRPPPPGATTLTPKPSAAPAPRLRPSAPRETAPLQDGTHVGETPLSAADEIAGMFSSGPVSEAADVQASFDSRQMLSAAASPAAAMRPKVSAGINDPFFFRKTTIPIHLTLGVVLAGWGILLITCGQDNALADLFPGWTPMVLFGFAAVFLILGAFNILSMKNIK